MNKEYVLIAKDTWDSHKISEEHTLNIEEIISILQNKDVLKKFIEQKAISIQFDIGFGKCQGEEHLYLKVVEQLFGIAKEIGEIDKIFNKYIKEQKEEKEKEN